MSASEHNPETADLQQRCQRIADKLAKPVDESDLDYDICADLFEIEEKALFRAPRTEEGKPEFETYEKFIEKLISSVRERLRQANDPSIKNGYKRINEAIVYNRIKPRIQSSPPKTRAQIQVLAKCKAERQAEIWDWAVSLAAGRKITRKIVTAAARAKGVKIADQAPSNSSLFVQLRKMYPALRGSFQQSLPENLHSIFRKFDTILFREPAQNYRTGRQIESNQTPLASALPVLDGSIPSTKEEPSAAASILNRGKGFIVAGCADELESAIRPWAALYANTVYVAFNNRPHYVEFLSAGFPGLKQNENYSFRKDLFRGVWEHRLGLTEAEQQAEVLRIAELLAEASLKLAAEASLTS